MSLLAVEDLHVTFATEDGDVRAVRGVSFAVEAGETVGIVGESGSGKSVATQAMVRLIPGARLSGRVVFEGRDLLQLPEAELRRVRGARIGMVFQDPLSSLHPQYRVGWQIAEALRAHQRMGAGEGRRRAIALLEEVGLPQPGQRVDDYPHQFSGGMRQRVMVAMALALRPPLLIADEPTTALDVTVQAQLLALLAALQREHGTTVLFITHDLGVIAETAHRVLTMYAGRVIERADRDTLFSRPHHPYTRGLLASIPQPGAHRGALVPIAGQPPSLLAALPPCAFAPRCPEVFDRCLTETPPELSLSPGHASACWLPAEHAGPVRLADPPPPLGAVPAAQLLVRARGLTRHFPGPRRGLFGPRAAVHAVDGIDLDVVAGETLGIVGESGCGKSTLARLLGGLLAPTSGSVEIEGRDLAGLSGHQLRGLRRDVQFIFQDPYSSLNPRRRIGSIIGDPLVIHGRGDRQAIRARVQELMALVGLNPEHYNRFPAEFSGGQRQRVGIARALALEPKLLICDEPVSALDVSIQAQILNLLADLQRQLDLTYVVIAHDLALVEHLADRVAVMYLGRVVEIGAAGQLFADPRHPYTRALLDSAPAADPAVARRPHALLGGDVPSPLSPPGGCRFAPRCPRAQGDCRAEDPALVARLDGDRDRAAACVHPLGAEVAA